MNLALNIVGGKLRVGYLARLIVVPQNTIGTREPRLQIFPLGIAPLHPAAMHGRLIHIVAPVLLPRRRNAVLTSARVPLTTLFRHH